MGRPLSKHLPSVVFSTVSFKLVIVHLPLPHPLLHEKCAEVPRERGGHLWAGHWSPEHRLWPESAAGGLCLYKCEGGKIEGKKAKLGKRDNTREVNLGEFRWTSHCKQGTKAPSIRGADRLMGRDPLQRCTSPSVMGKAHSCGVITHDWEQNPWDALVTILLNRASLRLWSAYLCFGL